jgi:hypothetical protein
MGLFVGQPAQNSKPQFLSDIENGNNFNSGELGSSTNMENYQRYMPNYSEMYNRNNSASVAYPSQGFAPSFPTGDKNDVLIEKLNYMIKLLEEQQDEKTGNVTEEVILYSFLGIFIIFIVDSFARVGKYVR